MLIFKIIFFYLFLKCIFAASLLEYQYTTFVVDRFDGMCRGGKLPITQIYRVAKSEKYAIYLNVTLRIKEDIDETLVKNVKVVRCGSKENLDTCEDFLEQTNTSYCFSIGRLSPTYIDYVPKLSCPPRKGVYKAYNNKLDLLLIGGIVLNGYYWRTRMEVISVQSNKIIQCTQIDGYTTKKPQLLN